MFIFTTLHLSLLTAYDQCASEAEKEKLLSSIRYGKLKRFVEHIVNKNLILILSLWTRESQTEFDSIRFHLQKHLT